MPYVRKITSIVKAEQFFVDVMPWPRGVTEMLGLPGRFCLSDGEMTKIYDSYWILTDIGANLSAISNDEFKKKYEVVQDIKVRYDNHNFSKEGR